MGWSFVTYRRLKERRILTCYSVKLCGFGVIYVFVSDVIPREIIDFLFLVPKPFLDAARQSELFPEGVLQTKYNHFILQLEDCFWSYFQPAAHCRMDQCKHTPGVNFPVLWYVNIYVILYIKHKSGKTVRINLWLWSLSFQNWKKWWD